MLDRDAREALLSGSPGEGEGEGWLVSYLDVLTLLITLFVLLLALAGNGPATSGTRHGGEVAREIVPEARAASVAAAAGVAPLASGLQPRHDGLRPRFQGLEIAGVSVVAGGQGITLRIDDNLLFASGQAELTDQGQAVLERLVATLVEAEGGISVEGHTDSQPIATARFPSNWELSTARATAVLRHLAARGVPAERLRAIGYADTRPLESNETSAGRAANRRVELLLRQE